MEAFVASNEGQWDVIKRVIDEFDYYALIIGGRYGSITTEGIIYTEKEYRYAKEQGLPVLAFVHGDPESIPIGRAEKDKESREKLERFCSNVMADHPIRKWTTGAELGGLVSRFFVREIKISPRPGWIRNDGSSPIALLERINFLSEENRKLQDQLADHSRLEDDTHLESGDDTIETFGSITIVKDGFFSEQEAWSATASWNDIFRDIGPTLINKTTEDNLKQLIAKFHYLESTKYPVRSSKLALES